MRTIIIEDFLSDSEIFDIERRFRQDVYTKVWIEQVHGDRPYAHSHYWYPSPSYKDELGSFLNDRILSRLGDHFCDNWHILNAFVPYGIHTDSYDDEVECGTHGIMDGFDFGYTFLIPLADYEASTVVMNEMSPNMKVADKWIKLKNRQPLDLIDDSVYDAHLTHQSKELFRYFSIDTIFKWTKGSLLAMDRSAFHCSSNFIKTGLLEKRAIIGWSFIKKEIM